MLKRPRTQRRGVTTVETALVLAVFCLLLFGVFEYTRFLYMLHVTNNAARDGARYASVNQTKPSNFDTVDYTYTDASNNTVVVPNITSYTRSRMGGGDQQLGGATGCTITCYVADPTALAQTPPVVQPLTSATGAWQTTFPSRVAVTITGTYRPILPGFLFMPSSVPVTVSAVAGSEG
jgi:Flp pilus assembly protein TadG